ncbi:MAG: hypothetical protein AB7J28_03980 [Hyphomonadaceae bacterium]
MSRIALLALSLALAGAAAGCGHRGSLERPGPMWGDGDAGQAGIPDTAVDTEDDNPSERQTSPR